MRRGRSPVLVHGDEAEVVKRAETLDDVWARDVVPERDPHRAAQPDLAVTEDVATWVVAGLQVVAAVAFTGFWLTWRREPHDEPWLPDGYVEHEEVFVFPDVIVAITLVVSAVLLVLEEPFGASLASSRRGCSRSSGSSTSPTSRSTGCSRSTAVA